MKKGAMVPALDSPEKPFLAGWRFAASCVSVRLRLPVALLPAAFLCTGVTEEHLWCICKWVFQ
ncbi:hypothetical protein RBE51_27910 [Pseudomonas taiwanensis]|uniref:hypothetical protein n=1 Tax=Pseudomonas taiwanensis TaxID=470150 RepID=UPI0028DEAEC8|nr:hypothetical protein [Pseudomonas taiwanensis]MDT8926622.1 hypothetical protein [Pseudomonas taiwanensis]